MNENALRVARLLKLFQPIAKLSRDLLNFGKRDLALNDIDRFRWPLTANRDQLRNASTRLLYRCGLIFAKMLPRQDVELSSAINKHIDGIVTPLPDHRVHLHHYLQLFACLGGIFHDERREALCLVASHRNLIGRRLIAEMLLRKNHAERTRNCSNGTDGLNPRGRRAGVSGRVQPIHRRGPANDRPNQKQANAAEVFDHA